MKNQNHVETKLSKKYEKFHCLITLTTSSAKGKYTFECVQKASSLAAGPCDRKHSSD
jgi:hypothetical protein